MDERISGEEIDLFASASSFPLKKGDRVAQKEGDSYYVKWIEDITEDGKYIVGGSLVNADKIKKLKKNPLEYV